jgi:hypothetical protein
MKVKVTEDGVLIPKNFLEGVTDVEIRKENGLILVVPLADDPILQLGSQPVEDEDAVGNHDLYVLARKGLEKAYSKNEPEYSLDLIKEPNTEYEGR